MRQEGFVPGRRLQLGLIDGTQHADGIVAGRFPEVAIQAAKQFNRVVIPGPTQVVRQLAKSFERSGQ